MLSPLVLSFAFVASASVCAEISDRDRNICDMNYIHVSDASLSLSSHFCRLQNFSHDVFAIIAYNTDKGSRTASSPERVFCCGSEAF